MNDVHRGGANRHRLAPRWLLVLGVVIGMAGLASCGGTSDPADGDDGRGSLTVAINADPRSLWANSYTAQNEINVSEQITEKLIEFSVDASEFEPRLATKWEQIDPKTVRLTLREGVRFTNGESFDAESAKKSIDIMLAAPTYQSYTSSIAGAKTIGNHTLDIVSKKPNGLVLMGLAMGSFQYPPAYWDKVGEKGFGNSPIGTGPYVLDRWTKGVGISLKANHDYWGGSPASERLDFTVIADPAAQVAALQSGQVQFISDVPVGSIDTLKNDESVTVTMRDSNRVFYIGLSSLKGSTLVNPEVRKALAYAIDVQPLIDNQLDGYGKPLRGQILPPGYVGFDKSMPTAPYDPERARSMLKAAGASNLKVRFNYPSGRYAQDKELGQAISAQLEKVGVTVEQRVLEPGTFLTELVGAKLGDAYFAGLLLPPDAHMVYQMFSKGAQFSYNPTIPEVDKLMAEDATTVDVDKRLTKLKQIRELLAQDPPFVPLFQGADIYATSKSLKGFTPRASQFVDFAAVSAG